MRRRGLIVGAGTLLAAPAIVRAQGANGVALVIGNSKYKWEAALPNVKRDVPDIAKRFEQFGLKTELLQDAGHAPMKQAIDKFLAASRGANLAAFYFAGHGAQWEKISYIVPADADLGTPSVVKTLPSVQSIREGTREAARRLLIFDSCRNNPADDWRQKWAIDQGGVHRVDPSLEPNALMLFSTAPGRVALDGPAGQNSPFAAALLRQLASASVDLQTLPDRLRRDLLIATEGRQVLWDWNSLSGPVLLRGLAGTVPANPSGWSSDPARIVELPNAYALAQQKDLLFPPGLVAHRPRGGSSDAAKVGAFQVLVNDVAPGILVVMSVEDPNAVELLWSSRYKNTTFWRFPQGKISGDSLEFTGASWGARITLKWKDANAGSVSIEDVNPNSNTSGKISTRAFTRLDG